MVQCWCELKKISLLQCYVKYAVGAGTIKELCGIDGFSDCFEEYLHEFLNSSGHMITFVVLLYGRLFIIIIKNKTKTNSLLCPPPQHSSWIFFSIFFFFKIGKQKNWNVFHFAISCFIWSVNYPVRPKTARRFSAHRSGHR